MNYVALDPRAGAPRPGDLVWSALPDAPVQSGRGSVLARLRSAVARSAQRRRVAARRGTELPAVLAAELREALVPDRIGGRGDVPRASQQP